MTSDEIKATCEKLWNGPVLNGANRNIFAENMEIKTGDRVNTKPDEVAQARMRQARSRANRAAEGGKAFTVFLGPAEVRALEKIKAKLGADDASAVIRDALLVMAWSL